jgi:hypothetical protein
MRIQIRAVSASNGADHMHRVVNLCNQITIVSADAVWEIRVEKSLPRVDSETLSLGIRAFGNRRNLRFHILNGYGRLHFLFSKQLAGFKTKPSKDHSWTSHSFFCSGLLQKLERCCCRSKTVLGGVKSGGLSAVCQRATGVTCSVAILVIP